MCVTSLQDRSFEISNLTQSNIASPARLVRQRTDEQRSPSYSHGVDTNGAISAHRIAQRLTHLEHTMKSPFRNLSAIFLASIFVSGLAGCHTIAGVGKDTKKVGEKIEKEADRAREHKDGDGDTHRTAS
jgi:predicted small secreted protein